MKNYYQAKHEFSSSRRGTFGAKEDDQRLIVAVTGDRNHLSDYLMGLSTSSVGGTGA